MQLDVDRLELRALDVGILWDTDMHDDLATVGKCGLLLDRAAPEALAEQCTVRRRRDAPPVPEPPERVVQFRPQTILMVLGILIGVAVTLEVVWIARHVISWILIALFLALALNPAVDRLEGRLGRRGAATTVVYLAALAALVGIGFLFIPTVVNQVNDFAHKVPDYLNDVTKGRGRLGFLQTKYHLVDKARKRWKKEALRSSLASPEQLWPWPREWSRPSSRRSPSRS